MKPREKAPQLELNLINGTQWVMDKQDPEKYTMIVFYRGMHCPVCKKQLESLRTHLDEFIDRGINVIAISMDTEQKAKKTGEQWNIDSIPVGYELQEQTARDWKLFLSKGVSDKEPELFSEPAIYLINKQNEVYFASIQSMPFARPSFKDILDAIDFIEDKDYPARGEY